MPEGADDDGLSEISVAIRTDRDALPARQVVQICGPSMFFCRQESALLEPKIKANDDSFRLRGFGFIVSHFFG